MILHVCCAPCSIYSLTYWRQQGEEPLLFYFNPNIHPYAEYLKRRDTLLMMAEREQVPLILSPHYPLRAFLSEAMAAENRCLACYRLRLEETARQALRLGQKEFSTTLLISPYQQHEMLHRIGEEIAARCGLVFRYADLRSGFRDSQAEARQRGYYLQNYCGCLFSELERQQRRKAGKGEQV